METEPNNWPVTVDVQPNDGFTASWLLVDDEAASELAELLDSFQSPPPSMKVRFIEDPYSAAVVVQCSSAYITINGSEESCGPSFSDYDASAMASVDLSVAGRFRGAWLSGCAESSARSFLACAAEAEAEADVDVRIEELLHGGDGGGDFAEC